MKKTIILAAAMVATQIGTALAETPTAKPIPLDQAAAMLNGNAPGTNVRSIDAMRALAALCEKEGGGGVGFVQVGGKAYALLTCVNAEKGFLLRQIEPGDLPPAN